MTAPLPLPVFDLPAVYAVVGERCDDPACLLVQGCDGQHYAYRLRDGSVQPVAPDAAWRIDSAPPVRVADDRERAD